MKIIISERQQRLIKENSIREDLVNQIKEEGWNSASEMVGGDKNLMKVLKIDSPMDFLHLFDDMDIVQSEVMDHWTLFRYKPKKNLIIHDRRHKHIYIVYYEFLSVLEELFGLKDTETQSIIQAWLDEVYNLRGVTMLKMRMVTQQQRWMRSTI